MNPADPVSFSEDRARAGAIARGEEGAFRSFFDEAFPRVFRFVLRHCGNPSLAEELTQDALITALERMPAYRGESALMSWVLGIARHLMLRRRAVDARLLRFEDEVDMETLLEGLIERHGPEQRLDREQLVHRVHSVLDRLPSPYSECLEGKYVLGLSVRDMAAQQGRSEKSVESTLSRARLAFRQAFAAGIDAEVQA